MVIPLPGNAPMRLILLLPLALAGCAPTAPRPPSPSAERHAIAMLRRGYGEWVVRCAWAQGRFGLPLADAIRQCQLDLGLKAPVQSDQSFELAPRIGLGHDGVQS